MKTFLKNSGVLAVIVLGFLPIFAKASTGVTLTSSKTTVTSGQQFTLTIHIDPVTDTAYTSKIALSYSSDLIALSSFTLAPNWIALSQPGYDAIDQTTGSIIKTGGYPKGISSDAVFGTVVFTAKKSGVATISVTNSSQILNGTNQNVYSGNADQIQVAIGSSSAIPVIASIPQTQPVGSVATTSSVTSTSSNLVPPLASVGVSGADTYPYYILGFLVLCLIGLIVWKNVRK